MTCHLSITIFFKQSIDEEMSRWQHLRTARSFLVHVSIYLYIVLACLISANEGITYIYIYIDIYVYIIPCVSYIRSFLVHVRSYLRVLHPVSITRFPSFRTQPLEHISADSVNKHGFLSNPAPGEDLLSGNLVMETGCKV